MDKSELQQSQNFISSSFQSLTIFKSKTFACITQITEPLSKLYFPSQFLILQQTNKKAFTHGMQGRAFSWVIHCT